MPPWNTQPSAYADKLGSVLERSVAIRTISRYVLVAAFSAASSRYGYVPIKPTWLLEARCTEVCVNPQGVYPSVVQRTTYILDW
jgi:hypothetical protein